MLPISINIITYNEENNLVKCLESCRDLYKEIVIIDSGSTDSTLDIAKRFGAKTFHNQWKGYGQQRNFALQNSTQEWIFAIDADETVSSDLRNALLNFFNSHELKEISGIEVRRDNYFLGKRILFGGWTNKRLLRFARKKNAIWTEPVVHESLDVTGKVIHINSPINHLSYVGIESQITKNLRYAFERAIELKAKKNTHSSVWALMRGFLKFIECYFYKLGFLDGSRGLIIAINTAHAMFVRYAFLLELETRKTEKHDFNS